MGAVSESAKAHAREYRKAWSKRNREQRRESCRKWYWNNLERERNRCREKERVRRELNPEMVQKNLESLKRWVAGLDKEVVRKMVRDANRNWVLNNPEKVRAMWANRDALKKKAIGTIGESEVKFLIKLQGNRCANPKCRKPLNGGYHIDHIDPLCRSLDNRIHNLQLLCPFCNLSKGAKTPEVWAKEVGLLFV